MNITQILLDNRLDCEALADMYEGDYEHAEVVFKQFVKNAPAQMKEIDFNYEKDAVADFKAKIHKLKPVFSFVGLTGLSNKAALLEEQCNRVNTLKILEKEYTSFKNEFDTGLPVVQEILQKLSNEI